MNILFVHEAMSVGCVVIGSGTAPVREVIEDNQNGLLVPFFDVDRLAERVVDALAGRERHRGMRAHARQSVLDHYDLARISPPGMMRFVRGNGFIASRSAIS
jgi:glycosyltransferase involved in cell wall biosynthesis